VLLNKHILISKNILFSVDKVCLLNLGTKQNSYMYSFIVAVLSNEIVEYTFKKLLMNKNKLTFIKKRIN